VNTRVFTGKTLPMDVRSLAFRTDLALLQLGGSIVTDRGTHLVVRTPDNPSFYWGNFLLLRDAPAPGRVDHWLAEIERELPEARHRALGVDGTDGSRADVAGLADAGFDVEVSVAMTATVVHPPSRPHRDAVVRPLASDDDWGRQLEMSLAGEDVHYTRRFATARTAQFRRLTEAGHGRWYGAFLGAELTASLGVFSASPGLARFQSVKTHPDFRGRGLAGTLVHAASAFALDGLGAHTLVMVADPDYPAIRVYRSVGFADTERQLAAIRLPATP